MEEFNFLAVLVAGICAVIVMNIFIFLFTILTRSNIQLFALLGTFVTKETTKHQKLGRSKRTLKAGATIFYLTGILAAFLYAILWHFEIAKPSVMNASILGFFTGVATLLILNYFLKHHPYPLKIRLADYFSTLLIGWTLFAINFLYFYLMFKVS